MKNGYVYIITNKNNTVLYIGVTSNLPKRIYEHKNKIFDGFSKEFNLYKLVYYEGHDSMEAAIIREKQLKKWKREWKDKLINEKNIYRNDLSEELQ
ncbi:MAG: GIY-YIG nuclease family protein [Candidatus Gracilibacteria bacterium]|nr:GIY-YIG nuclease family protein [Candidatus Gracilibacteria bacterium]MDD3120043.1 GIY-YIG nuclease family protein [Candidatus Gracilibacteria bacterium]MDD4530391.1 GIY-YIG nuclease family protein [Candidatus Gracilibacteria bacterium]